MGYRIEYAERAGTLRAVVSGKSSLAQARSIARDIAEHAATQAAKHVLIDVRRLVDRVGTLGVLVRVATCVPTCSVGVLDVRENDPHYVFPEHAARKRGADLHLFYNPEDAARWLYGEH